MKRITNYDRWYNKAVIYSSICLKHWVLIKGQVFFSPLFSWFLRLSSRLRKIIWFHDMCMLVGSKFITVNLLNWLAKITASEKSFYRGKKSNVSKKEYLLGLCLSQLHLQYRRHAKQPRFFHMRKNAIYLHIMEYYSAIITLWNIFICRKRDGYGGHQDKWSVPVTQRERLNFLLPYTESK